MSRLLIDEQPLQVIPSLAAKIGLNRAMFLQQLHYWLQKSKHVHDGKVWVFNTYEEWHEQFPFWSAEAVRKIVSQLEAKGIVETTDKYNERRGDRTKWYTIDYEALAAHFAAKDHPDKSTEQPDKSTELDPDKSTERYQRVPETNNRDSDLQSGEAQENLTPSPPNKPVSPKSFAISRLMELYAEAKEQGRQPTPPDEPYKRRTGDIYAAHFAEGKSADELEPVLAHLVACACGDGPGWLKEKKRWIPFVDAVGHVENGEHLSSTKPTTREERAKRRTEGYEWLFGESA